MKSQIHQQNLSEIQIKTSKFCRRTVLKNKNMPKNHSMQLHAERTKILSQKL